MLIKLFLHAFIILSCYFYSFGTIQHVRQPNNSTHHGYPQNQLNPNHQNPFSLTNVANIMIQIKILNSTRQAPYISNLDVWYHDGFWHQQASPATWWRIWASILIFLATHFLRLFSSLSCDAMLWNSIYFLYGTYK